jgi:hypothetical protein
LRFAFDASLFGKPKNGCRTQPSLQKRDIFLWINDAGAFLGLLERAISVPLFGLFDLVSWQNGWSRNRPVGFLKIRKQIFKLCTGRASFESGDPSKRVKAK